MGTRPCNPEFSYRPGSVTVKAEDLQNYSYDVLGALQNQVMQELEEFECHIACSHLEAEKARLKTKRYERTVRRRRFNKIDKMPAGPEKNAAIREFLRLYG